MRIINDIQQYSLKDYNDIVKEFTQFFSQKYPQNVTLYQFGNTAHPSVSDLDLAIVIDDKKIDESIIRAIIKDAQNFICADKRRQYIFTHDILIFPDTMFKFSVYDSYMPNRSLLYGDDIKPDEGYCDLNIIWKLRYINYVTNAIRNYKKMIKQKETGLRDILKLYNIAYHQIDFYLHCIKDSNDSKHLETLKEEIKTERQKVIQQSHDTSYDINQIFTFLENIFTLIFKQYEYCMTQLSEEITGEQIHTSVLFFENKTLVKKHLLYLLTGALYGQVYKEKKHCYAMIYKEMYPVDISYLTVNPDFIQVIQKQADSTLQACSFYKRFGIRIGGPMMCSYCIPKLSKKDKLRFTLQKILYRLQGIK